MFIVTKFRKELERILNRFRTFVDILATMISFIIPNLIVVTLLTVNIYSTYIVTCFSLESTESFF